MCDLFFFFFYVICCFCRWKRAQLPPVIGDRSLSSLLYFVCVGVVVTVAFFLLLLSLFVVVVVVVVVVAFCFRRYIFPLWGCVCCLCVVYVCLHFCFVGLCVLFVCCVCLFAFLLCGHDQTWILTYFDPIVMTKHHKWCGIHQTIFIYSKHEPETCFMIHTPTN